jgi:hypothetical protein
MDRVRYRWVVPLLLLTAVVLVPWTLYLGYRLPASHRTDHWDVAWVGFDIVLAASFAATAYGVVRRAPWVQAAAVVTATLLVTDAWFDNWLANGMDEHVEAAFEAVFAELPLAFVCLWLARNCHEVMRSVPGASRLRRRQLPVGPLE